MSGFLYISIKKFESQLLSDETVLGIAGGLSILSATKHKLDLFLLPLTITAVFKGEDVNVFGLHCC
jgi:hypothetical protein